MSDAEETAPDASYAAEPEEVTDASPDQQSDQPKDDTETTVSPPESADDTGYTDQSANIAESATDTLDDSSQPPTLLTRQDDDEEEAKKSDGITEIIPPAKLESDAPADSSSATDSTADTTADKETSSPEETEDAYSEAPPADETPPEPTLLTSQDDEEEAKKSHGIAEIIPPAKLESDAPVDSSYAADTTDETAYEETASPADETPAEPVLLTSQDDEEEAKKSDGIAEIIPPAKLESDAPTDAPDDSQTPSEQGTSKEEETVPMLGDSSERTKAEQSTGAGDANTSGIEEIIPPAIVDSVAEPESEPQPTSEEEKEQPSSEKELASPEKQKDEEITLGASDKSDKKLGFEGDSANTAGISEIIPPAIVDSVAETEPQPTSTAEEEQVPSEKEVSSPEKKDEEITLGASAKQSGFEGDSANTAGISEIIPPAKVESDAKVEATAPVSSTESGNEKTEKEDAAPTASSASSIEETNEMDGGSGDAVTIDDEVPAQKQMSLVDDRYSDKKNTMGVPEGAGHRIDESVGIPDGIEDVMHGDSFGAPPQRKISSVHEYREQGMSIPDKKPIRGSVAAEAISEDAETDANTAANKSDKSNASSADTTKPATTAVSSSSPSHNLSEAPDAEGTSCCMIL